MSPDTAIMDADELAQLLEHIAENLPTLEILNHGYSVVRYLHTAGPPPTPLPTVPENVRIVWHAASCPRLGSAHVACRCAPIVGGPWGITDVTPRKATPGQQRHTLSQARRSEIAKRSWAKRRARAQA
jgi:hypothetical protein